MSKKVAVITGGGTGIGRESALQLQADGWDVVVTGRRKEELEKTVAMAKPGGGKMLAVAADVTKEAEVKRLFAETVKTFGRVDFLFNNAGMGAPAVPMDELTFEQWKAVVDINLTGVFLCMQQAFRVMKAQTPQGGRIINNGSISATTPRPFSAPYTSTKHGVLGLTKVGSLDGRAHDIAVGQIDIGNAASDMTQRMTTGVLQPNGTLMAEPRMDLKHVADAVVHMASLPLEANVQFMTVMATKMPFVGRG